MTRIILVLSIFCVAFVLTEKVSYRGHKVLRIQPKDVEELTFLKSLEDEYDFWKEPVNLKQPVDVRVSPKQFVVLTTKLTKRAIKYSVMIEDVDAAIQRQLQRKDLTDDTGNPALRLDEYHTLEEIQTYMRQLAQNFTNLVELITLPEPSYEGREILLLKLSTGGTGKPGFWFDSAINPREWISSAVVVYMLTQMVNLYGNDPDVTMMLDSFDWYILPVFNVDGYEYTWTDERLWRKTKSPNEGSTCIGTDPNRNWDIDWGVSGVSHDPCSEIYCGPSAFSEIEVRTVVEYLESIDNMQAYLAYHNYGQMYMVPYGFQQEPPPDFDELMEVCMQAEAAIEAVYGTLYVCDQLFNLVGANSGSSADYTYEVAGIKYSYGVELRDTGDFGYLLPEDQIIPTSEESFEGLKVFAAEILNRLPAKK